MVPEGKGGEIIINQDKHASIHVANAYNTFKYKDVMRLNV